MLRLQGYHLLWHDFPDRLLLTLTDTLAVQQHRHNTSRNPDKATPVGLTPYRFRLFPVRSPLLRESLFIFFSSGYLDGSVRRVCFVDLCIQSTWSWFCPMTGYPIRKSMDLCSFAAPHGLSQLVTSFFASQYLGIHRIPHCCLP